MEITTRIGDGFDLRDQGVEVVFYDPIKGNECAVDIVDDFHLGAGFGTENCESAAEDLAVSAMLWNEWQEVLEQPRFSARLGDDRARFGWRRRGVVWYVFGVHAPTLTERGGARIGAPLLYQEFLYLSPVSRRRSASVA